MAVGDSGKGMADKAKKKLEKGIDAAGDRLERMAEGKHAGQMDKAQDRMPDRMNRAEGRDQAG